MLNKPRSVVVGETGSLLWKQFLAVPAFALLAANTHAPAASVRLGFQENRADEAQRPETAPRHP